MNRINDKILDKLRAKLAKETPYRSDFVLADFQVLDADRGTATVLVHYDERAFGVPSKETVAESLLHLYRAQDGRPRLLADAATVKHYPKHQAVSCTVRLPTIRRPIEDVKRFNLKPIVAGTVFLGENMEDTWKVGKSAEGSIFIERLEDDDIDTILRERSKSKAFRTHATTSLTLNRIAASASEINYSVGDKVNCAYKGKMRAGEIVGLSALGAQVRFGDGEQATLTTAALHGLVKAAAKSNQVNKQALKEYYRKAYGFGEAELDKLVSTID